MQGAPAASLARTLALAYALLIAYASLYPVAEWRDSGAPLTAFLTAAWPRYYSGFDIGFNVAAYLPLGLLAVPALSPPLGVVAAVLVTAVGGTMLSLGMETLQHFLPSRVPSNVDLAANALGSLIGALIGARWRGFFRVGGGLDRWRAQRIAIGRRGDVGLTLVFLWLLSQINPETLLFGAGDLRSLLELPAPVLFYPERYQLVETLVAASGLLAAGLLGREIQREFSPWLTAALILGALSVKALAWAVLVGPESFAQWVTPGNRTGILLGVSMLIVSLFLGQGLRTAVAALALLAATALVNLAPENPYTVQVLARWYQGHFFNFNGLTRLASVSWPFLTLCYLVAVANRRHPVP